MRWARVVGGVLMLAALLGGVLLLRSGGPPDVRRVVQDAGIWAPVLFVALQATLTVTPVPRTVFTVAAGVLFGSVAGLGLTLLATALAATAAFWLFRLVGEPLVMRYSHVRGLRWLRGRLKRGGLLAMVSLRLIPAVPFAPMNYLAGASGTRFAPFLAGTVLGVLPGTTMIVVLGDAAVGGTPHPAMLVVSIGCGLIGAAGAVVAARRAGAEPEAEPEAVPATAPALH